MGDGDVFGFSRAVRTDGGVTRLFGEFHGRESFRETTDLIDLHENGIGRTGIDAPLQASFISDEDIVPNQLNLLAQCLSHETPPVPVVFGKTIFNGNNRILSLLLFVYKDHLVYIALIVFVFSSV